MFLQRSIVRVRVFFKNETLVLGFRLLSVDQSLVVSVSDAFKYISFVMKVGFFNPFVTVNRSGDRECFCWFVAVSC